MLGQTSDNNQLIAYIVIVRKSKLLQKNVYLRQTLNSFQCMYFISYVLKNKMKRGRRGAVNPKYTLQLCSYEIYIIKHVSAITKIHQQAI